MNHKRRRFAALLGILLLSAFLVTVPALAAEGIVPYTDGTGDTADEPPVSFPDDPVPPDSTPEPPPESTPEPPVDSSEEPPVSSEPPIETPDPTEPPYEEPTQPPETDGGGTAGTSESSESSSHAAPAATPRPTSVPTEIEKPTVERPRITLNASSAGEAGTADGGQNYRTFAKLNLKNNSLSITLFYTGTGCILLGVAGLVMLLIFFLRGRRMDERDGIIEEIEEAENRQSPSAVPLPPAHTRPAASGAQPPQGQLPQAARRPASPGQPPAARPQGANPRPAAQPPRAAQRPAPRQNDPNAPIMPVSSSVYTEEFTLPEEHRAPRQAAPTAPTRPAAQQPAQARPAPPQRAPQQPAAPVSPPKAAGAPRPADQLPGQMSLTGEPPAKKPRDAKLYDTDEILREVLGDQEKH